MDMSSYQFVNTLAQCYEANAQLQGGASGVSTGAAGSDYYGMQYPNCYSPATQAYQGAGYRNMMASATASAASATGAASTQPPPLEYAPTSSSTTSMSTHTPTSSRRSPGPLSGSVAGTPAPLTTANVNCKYQDSNVGSPQDLSTTSSGGGTPHPGGMPGGLKSPDSDIEDDDPTSPMSPDPKEGGASSSATSTKKEDSKSTPPQIYPWMKRVHLGQSKYPSISLFLLLIIMRAGHNYKSC